MSQAMTTPQAPAQRLKRARLQAGFESARQFARYNGVKVTTYQHHENGRRVLTVAAAKLYARLLNLPAWSLITGETLHKAPTVPIVYLVVEGGVLMETEEALLPVVLPSAAATQLIATLVTHDQLSPVYRNGDTLFHRKLQTRGFDVDPLHGLDCAVQLDSGEILLRQVTVQPDGRVTLTAYGAVPARVNVRLIAGCPVEIVQRRLPRDFAH